jgi:uncharacterized membrane protein
MRGLKQIGIYLLGVCMLTGLAAKTNASDLIEVSPINFVILENDLGQKMPITITNNSNTALTFTITECLAERIDGKIRPIEGEITKSLIEIEESQITVKVGETGTITTRVRISASGDAQIPCVTIAPIEGTPTDISASASFIIPYIVQNFKGEQNLDITVDIGTSGIITSPQITIKGDIRNTGDKFFSPKGTILISKGGVKLEEKEITTQILGLMMPGESKPYEITWTNQLEPFAGIGDYEIDVKISTDQSSNLEVQQLIFTYVHTDVILLGSIIGVALLAITIGVVVLKKR